MVSLNPFDKPYAEALLTMRSIVYYMWLVIISLGIVTNVLNIAVFARMGLKDNVTTTLFALSVSDLAFLLSKVPPTFGHIIQISVPGYPWPFDPNIITIWTRHLSSFFYNFSSLVSAFLALVRCMCVAKPLVFKSMFSMSKTVKILVILFGFGTAVRLPLLTSWRFFRKVDPKTNLTYISYRTSDYHHHIVFLDDIVNTNILTWLTFGLVAVCAIVLTYKLKEASNFRLGLSSAGKEDGTTKEKSTITDSKSPSSETSGKTVDNKLKNYAETGGDLRKMSARDVQVIKSVTLVCVTYILAYMPDLLIANARLIDPEFDIFGRWSNIFRMCSLVSTTASVVNGSVNILIYFRFNSKFRETLSSFCGFEMGHG